MGTTLHPGAEVRIYRDGTELVSSLIAPCDHHLEVRHLDPGSYVARDGVENEVPFVVDPQQESAVLRVKGSHDSAKPSGPGGSLVDPVPAQAAQSEPTRPDPVFASKPKADVESDVPVPAEPGSALVETIAEPHPPLLPGQKVIRVNREVAVGETDRDGNALRTRRRGESAQVKPEPKQDATQATEKQAAKAASPKPRKRSPRKPAASRSSASKK